jgi:hypothetical protein
MKSLYALTLSSCYNENTDFEDAIVEQVAATHHGT